VGTDALVVDALVLYALVVDALVLDALLVDALVLDALVVVEMVLETFALDENVVLEGMVLDLWLVVVVEGEQPLLLVMLAVLLELNPKQLQLMQLLQPKCLCWRSCLPLRWMLDSSSLLPF
jgi:hypothetical protein